MWLALFIILGIMAGSGTVAAVATVAAMMWTGRLSLPGSDAHKLNRARVNAQIEEFNAQAEEQRFRTTQAQVNRDLMEAQAHLKLEEVQAEGFRLQLAAGEPIKGNRFVKGEVV